MVKPAMGYWSGDNITFYVSADRVKITGVGNKFEYGSSMILKTYGEDYASVLNIYDDIPINSDGTFSYRNSDVYVEGKFTSRTTASGIAESNNGTATSEWTAQSGALLWDLTGHKDWVRSARWKAGGLRFR